VEDEVLDSKDTAKGKVKSWMTVVEEKSQKIFDLLPKELAPLDKSETAAKNPIFRFLKREAAVAGGLLKKVRSDLQKLIEMCKGTIKSTNDLRAVAIDIFNDTIPKAWKIYQTIELTITEFVMDLRNRVVQLNHISQKSDFGKNGIWLGGLIFPEAFLTATRQYVAQSLKVSLDELKLNILLPENIEKIEENDFVVSGLTIEGAEWSYKQKKLMMTDNLNFQLPEAIFRWSKSNTESREFYIPVYLNSTRKNLLFSVLINNDSELSESDWYQRGIGFIGWNKTFEYKAK